MIVKEGMANGRLADPYAPDALKAVAAETSLGCDAVALGLILREPWAGVVLSGAATVTQLASNLHAAVVDLDEDQLARLATLVQEAGRLLGAARPPALALTGRHLTADGGESHMPILRHQCLIWSTLVSWLSTVTMYSAPPRPC